MAFGVLGLSWDEDQQITPSNKPAYFGLPLVFVVVVLNEPRVTRVDRLSYLVNLKDAPQQPRDSVDQ